MTAGVLVSHPTGTQNVRALLRALAARDLLDRFHTTLGISEAAARGLPPVLRRRLDRRTYSGLPARRIAARPALEMARLLSKRAGVPLISTEAVYRSLDRAVAHALRARRSAPRLVYCFEDGALETFRAAEEVGADRVLDVPAPYWRVVQAISREEAEREPEWHSALPALYDGRAKNERKDEELARAQHVAVPSSFARRALPAEVQTGVIVYTVPFGAPACGARAEPRRRDGPLRVLFAGNLNQQKGLSYLLGAVRLLGRGVSLTLLGPKPVHPCRPLGHALQEHLWLPPRSHQDMLEAISAHDVLVLPTLCDGFGLVMLEAMSRGLPVVATPNCAAPELVEDGVDGFIVPIRDSAAIAQALDRLLTGPDLLQAMGEAALRKAALHGWQRYERQIGELAASWIGAASE